MNGIYFSDEAYDTARKLVEGLDGYCVSLRTSRGFRDVKLEGFSPVTGDLLYRDWKEGVVKEPQRSVPFEKVHSITVF